MIARELVYQALRTADLEPLRPNEPDMDPDRLDPEPEDAPAQRLKAALGSRLLAVADLLPLVRHLLRSEPDAGRIIRVTSQPGWPQRIDWERHGFRIHNVTTEGYQLDAGPWEPQWLPDADKISPDADPFAAILRHQPEAVTGDPFLLATGFHCYRGVGQEQAVRAVLSAPPGTSLIVNLPTGSGKSLCAHALGRLPFLDGDGGRGVVVVVVPTTALALDQARAFGGADRVVNYAYTGGGEGNENIRRRIRTGEQQIVFTSPEAMTASLRPSLYEAREAGLLKALVVDEAHMIDLWGDEFRPAFQEIAGLRRALLRLGSNPGFRTILLSATLTQAAVSTLQHLFGDPTPCRMSAAVQLRPEPAYWVRRFEVEEDRVAAVCEALRYLPRPAILYVTERAEAYAWETRLRGEGHRRLDCMTGDTPVQTREAIIRRWTENRTDVVVATAAFGLGMDKGDVRTVLHACLPETLDRYYQEVGRGGRDGRACISLLLYTPRDERIAGRLATKHLITTGVGLRRWRAMFAAKEILPDGRIRVDLRTPPGTSLEHIDMIGTRSVEWNARTLTLLQRAGLIELDDSISEGGLTESRTLTIKDEEHLTENAWQKKVETYRGEALAHAASQRRSMTTLVRARQCASITLKKLYQIDGVEVARACGGCPACRRLGWEPFIEAVDPSAWPWPPAQPSEVIQKYAHGGGGFVVYFPRTGAPDRLLRSLRRFVAWVVRQSVSQIVIPPEWPVADNVLPADGPVITLKRFQPKVDPALPTLVLHPAGLEGAERSFRAVRYRLEGNGHSSLCLLLMIDNAADPAAPGRSLRDTLRCPQYALETLLERERIA